MALQVDLDQEFKIALKAKNKLKVNTLRLLKSSIKNKEIELKKKLNDDEIIKVLRKELKKREESIKAYKKAKRLELVAQEEKEFHIINKYLPTLMSEEEVIKIVDQVIEEGLNNFGQIMKEVMIRAKGQAAGQLVQKIVKDKI